MPKISKLTERYQFLPENCHHSDGKWLTPDYLNIKGSFCLLKGGTGYGGTTTALNSSGKFLIIITPNRQHVIGKEAQYPTRRNAAGVPLSFIYGGSDDKWGNAIQKGGHIYCTYDQLILQIFADGGLVSKRGYDFIGRYDFIVDEYHLMPLINGYRFNVGAKLFQYFRMVMSPSGVDAKATESRVIFTSASYFDLSKVDINIPKHLYYTDKHNETPTLNHYINSNRNAVIHRANEGLTEGYEHIFIFTQKVEIFQSFIEPDTMTGALLGSKLALYTDEDSDETKLDLSKRIHIISSTAWTGYDIYESNSLVLIYGEYGINRTHLLIGEEDIFQIIGRFRNGCKNVELHTKTHKSFQALLSDFPKWIEGEDELKEIRAEIVYNDTTMVTDRYHKSLRFKYRIRKSIPKRKTILQHPTLVDAFRHLGIKSAHYYANHIHENIQYRKVNESRTKRNSFHSGLRPLDATFILMVSMIGEHPSFRRILELYEEGNKKNKDRALKGIVSDFYQVICQATQSDEFQSLVDEQFSEYNVNWDRLYEAIDNPERLPERFRLLQYAVGDLFTALYPAQTLGKVGLIEEMCNTTYIDDVQFSSNKNQNTNKIKAFSDTGNLIPKVYDFVYLYNSLMLPSAVITTIAKWEYECDTEAQKDGWVKYKKAMQSACFDYWLGRKGLNADISIITESREYNGFVMGKKVIRALLPTNVIEVDVKAIAPNVAAAYLKSLESDSYADAIKDDAYTLIDANGKRIDRDIAKKMVNTALNLWKQTPEQRITALKKIGMKEIEASVFVRRFPNRGDWYRYYTAIERNLMQGILEPLGLNYGRLHDAVYIPSHYENQIPTHLTTTVEGLPYMFKLKVSSVNYKPSEKAS